MSYFRVSCIDYKKHQQYNSIHHEFACLIHIHHDKQAAYNCKNYRAGNRACIVALSSGLTESGAVAVDTGIFTGRSPRDKYIVRDDLTRDTVWWADSGLGRNDNTQRK